MLHNTQNYKGIIEPFFQLICSRYKALNIKTRCIFCLLNHACVSSLRRLEIISFNFFPFKDAVWTVMTGRFRLPAGRTYNVRASELARDRQHTEVVCNILLLDNTVQAFRLNVSTVFKKHSYNTIFHF